MAMEGKDCSQIISVFFTDFLDSFHKKASCFLDPKLSYPLQILFRREAMAAMEDMIQKLLTGRFARISEEIKTKIKEHQVRSKICKVQVQLILPENREIF